MARDRIRGTVFLLAVGVVAIVGGFVAGRWAWAIIAGLLALLAVTAGAAARAGLAAKRRRQQAASAGMMYSWNWTVDSERDTYVAGGDIRITKVFRRSGIGGQLAICLVALLLIITGTAYYGNQPGGQFNDSPSTGAAGGPAGDWIPGATFDEKDSSTGDHVIQVVSFQHPVPLTQVSAAESLIQIPGCELGPVDEPVSRDLAVPFRIISTLKSDEPVQDSLLMSLDNLYDASGNTVGLVSSPGDVAVGEYQGTRACGEAAAINLSPGEGPVTYYGWFIFPGAISPNHPDGSALDLGETYAQLELAQGIGPDFDNISEAGPWLCAGNANSELGTYLHIGGTIGSWERCNQRYDGPPPDYL